MMTVAVASLVMSPATQCSAQTTSSPQVTWQTKPATSVVFEVGAQTSILTEPSGPFAQEARSNIGWMVGLGIGRRENRRFGAMVEIHTGKRRTTELLAGTHRPLLFEMDFVEAPVMVRVSLGSPKMPIRLSGGFALGFRFHGTSTLSSQTVPFKAGAYTNAVVGVGTMFRRLLVEARYDYGLTGFAAAKTSLGAKYFRTLGLLVGLRIK
jgi:hypothetical protein